MRGEDMRERMRKRKKKREKMVVSKWMKRKRGQVEEALCVEDETVRVLGKG